ncbi:TIGR03862 family flavoprotein [Caballeronia sordidicola]|uniref:NAD(FAD)-utilizing dehydrogenase n=1 Tax=Caballeronia sordidicola TaxID=196367 RepID=A0A242MYN3_CABSO|nr:TIGR03862 family flavoprotein [Caballeronia sordidicola]OTP76541.1 NAD(FAD)-utilizing dehydrogenase [Caballeronia sordidicola]
MPSSIESPVPRVAVIGGGPAGLMAAEALAAGGVEVDLYDAMPSVGRKFLMAGKGGMNLTHSEPAEAFLSRYGERRAFIEPLLRRFDATALRAWVHDLGVETFIGSSGRVFPTDMKAAPMLRAWLHRLRGSGVRFHMRHKWIGWDDATPCALRFATPEGDRDVHADAVVLALGGASWPRLGSDAAWIGHLEARDVSVAPFKPSNCGFDINWSEHFSSRFAGEPLKSVAIGLPREDGGADWRAGECLLTSTGIEGSLTYAMSARIRDRLAEGHATFLLDLVPALTHERVHDEVTHPRGARSMSSHLQSRLKLTGAKAGLLRECLTREDFADATRLAQRIKALPLTVTRPRPIAEAISSAGGVRFESLDSQLMLAALPGVFCAGEMLDWEAPTGGYLLTCCFASGVVAGEGALAYLNRNHAPAAL